MLAQLLRRFASREAVLATAAQAAVTWGSQHLGTRIIEQAEQIDALTAELEQTRRERDSALEVLNDQADDLGPFTLRREDVDPLGKGEPTFVVTEDAAGHVEAVGLLIEEK